MNKRAKSKNLTKSVVILLTNNPEFRDDWLGTIRMIHDKEMETHNISHQDYYYSIFFTDKLSNIDTIKRLWAMVQEKRADLRGKSWEERQRQGGMIAKEMIFFDPRQLKIFDE